MFKAVSNYLCHTVFHYYAALNDTLKKEVERLKFATGEMMTATDSYNLGMHHIPYSQPSFFTNQQQSGSGDARNAQMSQFNPFQSNLSTSQQPMLGSGNSHGSSSSEMLQLDHIGRLQGLDISSTRGSHLVKPEGPSISASNSSNRFWSKCCKCKPEGLPSICWTVHRLTLLTGQRYSLGFHLNLIL